MSEGTGFPCRADYLSGLVTCSGATGHGDPESQFSWLLRSSRWSKPETTFGWPTLVWMPRHRRKSGGDGGGGSEQEQLTFPCAHCSASLDDWKTLNIVRAALTLLGWVCLSMDGYSEIGWFRPMLRRSRLLQQHASAVAGSPSHPCTHSSADPQRPTCFNATGWSDSAQTRLSGQAARSPTPFASLWQPLGCCCN